MAFLILLGICAVYIGLATLVSIGVFKFTQLKSLSAVVFLIVLVAPVHEGVFGYPVFRNFDKQHPGVQCEMVRFADGILVEGRRGQTPSDARRASSLPGGFRITELPREMVDSMKRAPREPLKKFVQFYLTTDEDPACTERFDSVPLRPNCIGVTSSDTPRSLYAVLQEPDRREAPVVLQLNDSKLFPIFGSHIRIRDLQTKQTIAEEWSFGMHSKVLPIFSWFSKTNPPGRPNASLCIRSTGNSWGEPEGNARQSTTPK